MPQGLFKGGGVYSKKYGTYINININDQTIKRFA